MASPLDVLSAKKRLFQLWDWNIFNFTRKKLGQSHYYVAHLKPYSTSRHSFRYVCFVRDMTAIRALASFSRISVRFQSARSSETLCFCFSHARSMLRASPAISASAADGLVPTTTRRITNHRVYAWRMRTNLRGFSPCVRQVISLRNLLVFYGRTAGTNRWW